MSSLPRQQGQVSCFDGSTHVDAEAVRPDRTRHWAMLKPETSLTVRGGGYSYAPAAVGEGSLHVDMRSWNRVLSFDRSTGSLVVEAGVTLGDVHRLASADGWHLPAQPGYPLITIGGCIAADVHGKNQHVAGNFRHCVVAIDLWHPDHGEQHLPATDERFSLTMGGLGLTGVVLRAHLQLESLPSDRVLVSPIMINDVDDTVRALHAAPDSLFSYTWQDFTRRSHVGRGVAFSARYSEPSGSAAPASRRFTALDPQRPGWPVPMLTRPTTRLMNATYGVAARHESTRPMQLFDFLFPAARRATYFKLFGRPGFHEAQVLVNLDSAPDFLGAVAELARARRSPVTLASCKLFAGAPQGIRFDGTGIVLAVDAPRSPSGTDFIDEVHRLMVEFRGRPNLVKDSRLSREIVEASIPELDDFRASLHRYDPARRFRSTLSDRLGL